MSDDGFSDSFDESLIEIQIRTLMGTSFDVKLSPSDTVLDIKKKIFRVEGIPIYNQNLIFQSVELKDSIRLCDSGITNRSSLTLVTNMKGGPISTRRLSLSCEHHMVLKELKKLLENTREELTPGSKISVLVFKEGEIINLLRVIENEDGSYSPYSENPISPPTKTVKRETQMGVFQRLVEDTQMCTKIDNLRKKMADASNRKQSKGNQHEVKLDFHQRLFVEPSTSSSSRSRKGNDLNFKFLEECTSELLDNVDLTVFEKNPTEETQLETEEVALKDKHRIKPRHLQPTRPRPLQPLIVKNHPPPPPQSLYRDRKGAYSHVKQNFALMQRKKDPKVFDRLTIRDRSLAVIGASTSHSEGSRLDASGSETSSSTSSSGTSMPCPLEAQPSGMDDIGAKFAEQLHLLDEDDQDLYGESNRFPMSARNRVHLTRLVLSEGADRPKSSPDSIELEERPPDFWEIHEPASERLKHSATCKVGVLKHRQGLEYNYDSLENHPSTSNIKSEISGRRGGNYSKTSSAEYGVCSGANYFVPQFMSAPSAIPPQYAPKQPNYCDLYFRNNLGRSPLYSRRNSKKENEESPQNAREENSPSPPSFLADCSSIQRLKNDHPSSTSTAHYNLNVSTHSPQNSSFNNSTPPLSSRGLQEDTTSALVESLSSRREERRIQDESSTNLTLVESLSSRLEKLEETRRTLATAPLSSRRRTLGDATVTNLGLESLSSRIEKLEETRRTLAMVPLIMRREAKRIEDKWEETRRSFGGSNVDGLNLEGEVFGPRTELLDELYGFCNLGLSGDATDRKLQKEEEEELPPVITKKKSRCSECNKRLNITNIYNCRCGRIFCSQHRYSEVHRCTYDYKTEGRKILEHQNPLVTAEKIKRI